MHYRNEIDGLRAIAVIPVMLFHANIPYMSGGYVGVDIFFVISGYLITGIIINETENKSFSLLNFYERRARRILPALIFVVLLSIFASFFLMFPFQIFDFANSIIYVLTFISNFYFWQNTGGYFSGILVEQMPLLHTWSLAVEEQFYLIFPIFFLIFFRLGYKKLLICVLIVLLLSLFVAQYASFYHPRPNFFLIVTRAWEIMVGSICAILLINYKDNIKKSNFISFFGFLIIIISIFFYNRSTPFPSIYTLLPTLGTALIIIFSNQLTLIGKILSFKPIVFLGLISYGAYLWHQPILAFSRIYIDGEINKIFSTSICIISFLFAFFSWKYIEKPFRNKKSINTKNFLLALSFSIILIFAYSVFAIKSNGFSFLWPAEDRKLVSIHPLKAGEYVKENFNKHKDKGFPKNNSKNVLVIGDSFAQDFVNLLYETKYNLKFNISTRHILPRCGNLFVEKEIVLNLKKYNSKNCYKEKYYDASLKNLIKEADFIFLASSWEFDEVKHKH